MAPTAPLMSFDPTKITTASLMKNNPQAYSSQENPAVVQQRKKEIQVVSKGFTKYQTPQDIINATAKTASPTMSTWQPQAPLEAIKPMNVEIPKVEDVKQPMPQQVRDNLIASTSYVPPKIEWWQNFDVRWVLSQFGANVLKWDSPDILREKYPEFSYLDDEVFRSLGANIMQWDDLETIMSKYPELSQGQTPANIPSQAIKWAVASQGQNNKEWNDWLIPRFNNMSEGKDGSARKVIGWFLGNTIKSALNVWSDVANAALNPLDTAKGIGNAVLGTLINVWDFIGQDVFGNDQSLSEALQGTSIGDFVKQSDVTADQLGQMLKDRYGSWEAIQDTAYKDPVGMFSDALSIIGAGGWALKAGANAWKTSRFWQVAKVANAVDGFADDLVKVWAMDPYNVVQDGVMKWAKATAWYIGRGISNATKASLDWVKEWASGFSKEEVKGIQNNPYQAEYRDHAISLLDQEGKAPSNQELLRQPLGELGTQLLEKFDTYESSLSYAGEWYNKIQELDNVIDVTPAHSTIQWILDKYDIKVKSDWKLDFEDSPFIQAGDINAIQSIYDRAMWKSTTNVKWIINLRKAADSASKWDGRPTASTPVVKKIRQAIDDVAKDQVPQLRELDDMYSKQISEIKQLKEWIVYRQWDRIWQLRDNYQQIMKTLWGPNRDIMRERLLQIMPDIELRVDAINNLPKLVNKYTDTSKILKTAKTIWWGLTLWLLWWQAWGIAGWLGWLVAGAVWTYLLDWAINKLRKSTVERIFSEISPEAQQKLAQINAKMESKTLLMADEMKMINDIKQKLQTELAQQQADRNMKATNEIIKTPRLWYNPDPVNPMDVISPDGWIKPAGAVQSPGLSKWVKPNVIEIDYKAKKPGTSKWVRPVWEEQWITRDEWLAKNPNSDLARKVRAEAQAKLKQDTEASIKTKVQELRADQSLQEVGAFERVPNNAPSMWYVTQYGPLKGMEFDRWLQVYQVGDKWYKAHEVSIFKPKVAEKVVSSGPVLPKPVAEKLDKLKAYDKQWGRRSQYINDALRETWYESLDDLPIGKVETFYDAITKRKWDDEAMSKLDGLKNEDPLAKSENSDIMDSMKNRNLLQRALEADTKNPLDEQTKKEALE